MSLLRYVSHPNVIIDPDVPVPRWSLNAEGERRSGVMAAKPWTATIGRLITSDETKATMTAAILADALGLNVEVRADSGEVDRSATGYVSHERHEELAHRLFAEPEVSADGWERAIDAQTRIVAALADVLEDASNGPEPAGANTARPDVAVVGHGGVGTLLYCHLAGLAIDRVHDQPGMGYFWTYDRRAKTMQHLWLAIDHTD